MNQGRTVFAQVIEHAPHKAFQRCVKQYPGVRRLRSFTCWDQFLCMVFAQLTYRESLRDIEAGLGAVPDRLYHMGIRSAVSRSTFRQRREDPDLDRHLLIRPRRDPQKAPPERTQSLHNVTDPECQPLRENRAFTSLLVCKVRNAGGVNMQPVAAIRLRTGH
jgi:hypothetical protein